MSRKVVRDFKPSGEDEFELRKFASVKHGEQEYNMRSFAADEEFSVQDIHTGSGEEEPETIEPDGDEVTEEDYLPPSKLLRAEDGVVGQTVTFHKNHNHSNDFVESPVFSDIEAQQKEYPTKVLKSNGDKSPSGEAGGENSHKDTNADSENHLSYEELSQKLSEANAQLDAKGAELKALQDELPLKLEETRRQAYDEGYKKAQDEAVKNYEATREDYFSALENFNKSSLEKLDEIKNTIDAFEGQVEEVVVGFLRTIIGAERKISDDFATKLIEKNLERLKEFKDISFAVHPDDFDAVKAAFPNYVISTDTSLMKGGVRVITKIGEISLDVNNMIDDLETQIKQEFQG